MPQQLQFNFAKPRDATPEEQKEWINTEGKYWADVQGKLIIGISILQVSLVGFMLGTMFIIGELVK
tara:strand:+ start:1903 stop:2100 length:198 start_codon:yes stop_codon:yes gene_type:complete